MKAIEVEIRLRNNRLKKARLRLGMSQQELAKAIGVSQKRISQFELLQRSPLNKQGEWSEDALALSDYLYEDPETLFPPETHNLRNRPTVQRVEMDAESIPSVLLGQSLSLLPTPDEAIMEREKSEGVQKIIRESTLLDPRRKQVVEMYYGINGHDPHSFQEIADHFRVTAVYARILRDEGLEILRHSSLILDLRDFRD